ncbi:Ubiquitin-conjugating enzyme E2 6 [Wickerhamiella sorbophila]|uniref:Ubiquitin-conjugating enzyme E2 6 n=1 Tax=Wickerhamiella sorbophila TaxID=45607 RepID=A0A2T0FJY9_9ASCO|nr:Ubiquitin-conjugating enzyme E2 6 [Wickerhamiella sorbophila]PRT55300.1 Ubiquitin-conjugating enzyme E2 6 [Wickerhamiella sorbophila]
MATRTAHKRLTKEYLAIESSPTPFIEAHPSDSNILEWYYVITGAPDTPYAGGEYMGTLLFPPDYPFQPPSIRMITPSGRFKPNTRLCLSISDFHPDTWNPGWSVATILVGLLSFMNSEEATTGSLMSSERVRKDYAAKSVAWNRSFPKFCEEFPHLVARARTLEEASNGTASAAETSSTPGAAQPCVTTQPVHATQRIPDSRGLGDVQPQSRYYLWAAVAVFVGAVVWVSHN